MCQVVVFSKTMILNILTQYRLFFELYYLKFSISNVQRSMLKYLTFKLVHYKLSIGY
jgi:hypothetical protein